LLQTTHDLIIEPVTSVLKSAFYRKVEGLVSEVALAAVHPVSLVTGIGGRPLAEGQAPF
jgi:hypothetical protein